MSYPVTRSALTFVGSLTFVGIIGVNSGTERSQSSPQIFGGMIPADHWYIQEYSKGARFISGSIKDDVGRGIFGDAMNEMQRVYTRMLEISLPYLRVQLALLSTLPWWRWKIGERKRLVRSCYRLSEFVHNIPVSMNVPDTDKHHLWFVNCHAQDFFDNTYLPPVQQPLSDCIKELIALLPDELKKQTTWTYPG